MLRNNYEMTPIIIMKKPEAVGKHRSLLTLILFRFLHNKAAVFGLVVLAVMVVAAFAAPMILHETATYHPGTDVHPEIALQEPSWAHPLGTDSVGRDYFARMLYGARISLMVGFVSMFVSLVIGVCVGACAGYYGGVIDNLLMRVTDIFLAVPLYLILFVMSAFFITGTSDSVVSVIFLVGLFSWANTGRIARGVFLELREREYVAAARTIGAGDRRIILRHLLPNASGPLIVNATMLIGSNIITEATLSFFGFGIQPPTASWGNMLGDQDSLTYFTIHPILLLAPGIAILITVLSFNLIGDGLRDALDPHMTQR